MAMILSLSACVYDPSNLHPSVIDLAANKCRVYKVVQVKPKLQFQFDHEAPLSQCDGYFSVSPSDAAAMLRAYNAENHAAQ